MLCVLPVFKDDVPQLLNLLQWIRQLGGCMDHNAVIIADADTPAGCTLQLKEEAQRSFQKVTLIATRTSVKGWPQGPNELFLLALQFAAQQKDHWLFLEPDAVPLCPGWLDKLDIHYRATGALYMGQIVPCETPGLPKKHLTGVAIYPASALSEIAQLVRTNPSVPFDIITADLLAPIARHCELFQHLWGEVGNPPRFAEKGVPGTAVFDLQYLKPKAVLYHRNKDGSLIRLLRQRAGIAKTAKHNHTFIQLGRFGDIILLLPSLRYIGETTGIKPRLIVAKDYASVLDGVSYVEPIPLPVHWYMGMPEARRYADVHFGGGTVLQCYAHNWGINLGDWPNFMISMIDRTGVPLDLFYHLPLIFDLRSAEREKKLLPPTKKPFILINTNGVSSPFKHGDKLRSALSHLRHHVSLIDLGAVKSHRIYDLLGLMDRALGTITIDTATLHLAHGCTKPYIAFTVDGWCSSTPRGNCVLEVKYSQFPHHLGRIVDTVQKWV